MRSSIARLVTTLSAKEIAMDRLIFLLDQEHRFVSVLDLQGLAENGRETEVVLAEMCKLNQRCRYLLNAAVTESGLNRECTLTDLMEKVDGVERDELLCRQSKLFSLGSALNQRLSVSRSLLGKSLAAVDRSMELLRNCLNHSAIYGEAGRMVNSAAFGVFSREI